MLAVAVAALLTCPATSATQSSTAPDVGNLAKLPLEQLLDIEVASASRFAQRLADAPSLVSIVTAADIRAYGYRTLGDILRSMPGVHVTYDRNYTYLGVRGLARPGDYNGRILLLVDGTRVNDNLYEQGTPGTEFLLSTEVIERVEFVPGPGSSIYGANAFSAVVNVVTKRAADLNSGELSVAAGSHDARSATATYGRAGSASTPSLLLSVTYFDSPGDDLYFPEFDTPETNNGIARGLDFDRGYRLFAKAEWDATRLTVAASTRTKGIPTASFGQAFNDPRSQTTDTSAYLALNRLFKPMPDLEINAGVSYAQYDYSGAYVYGDAPRVVNRDKGRGEWIDVELQALSTRLANHKIVFGLDYRHNLRRDQSNHDVEPYYAYLDDRRDGHSYGVYVQDEFAISPQLLLNAGVRHDQHSAVGGSTNPRVALIWHATERTTGKLVYGTAFRAPNAYELFFQTDGWEANPDLAPERVKTTELILEHYLGNDGRLALAAFRSRIRGLVELDNDPSGEFQLFTNRSGADVHGVELDWDQRWASGVRVHASYTYQRAVDRTTRQVLSNAPLHLAKLSFSAPLAYWLDAGLDAQYVSRRATLASTAPSYAIANLTLIAHRLIPSLEIAASVYNLFDRRYGDPGSIEHVQNTISQDRRTFQLKATYAF